MKKRKLDYKKLNNFLQHCLLVSMIFFMGTIGVLVLKWGTKKIVFINFQYFLLSVILMSIIIPMYIFYTFYVEWSDKKLKEYLG